MENQSNLAPAHPKLIVQNLIQPNPIQSAPTHINLHQSNTTLLNSAQYNKNHNRLGNLNAVG